MSTATDGIDMLPTDTESELALIGCLILDSRRYHEVCGRIGPQDFWDDHHRAVYSAIETLMTAGAVDTRPRNDRAPIDHKVIHDRIRAMGHARVRLADYAAAIGTGWDYLYYAGRIAEASRRRAIAMAAHEMGRQARLSGDVESLVDATIRKAAELRVGAGGTAPVRSLSEIIRDDIIPRIENDAYGTDTDESLVSTGWQSLDGKLGNLHRGSLVIVAGRPSDGKTSFAANVACWNAVTHKRRVLFVSLEQPAMEIADQTWRSMARVGPVKQARDEQDRQYRIDRLLAETEAMSSDELLIWNPTSATVEQIEAICRLQSASNPLDLVVIDYLQLIRRPRNIQGVNYQLEFITQSLKQLALQLEVPILILAQLNREAVKGDEPQLHHLKDSNVESDADVVLLIWRPDQKTNAAKIKIGKNRHGVRDVVLDFTFVGECKRFVEPQPARNRDFDEWNQD